jgi:hypothetical protein
MAVRTYQIALIKFSLHLLQRPTASFHSRRVTDFRRRISMIEIHHVVRKRLLAISTALTFLGSLHIRTDFSLALLAQSHSSRLVALIMRSLSCKLLRFIVPSHISSVALVGAPRSSCTTHLRVTNPALRCQSLVPMARVAPAACALPMRCTSRCASTA